MLSEQDEPNPFAQDEKAQARFLEIVTKSPQISIRDAIRQATGRRKASYHRCDVKRLLDESDDFLDRYREARGYGDEQLRDELTRRAFAGVEDPASGRILLAMAKAHLPEHQERVALDHHHSGAIGVIHVEAIAGAERDLVAKLAPVIELRRAERAETGDRAG